MENPICAECGGEATMLIDDDWLCEECTSGMHEYDDDSPDTAPDGTCLDCGRLLVDPMGLYCPACQPETLPLEPGED